MYEGEWCLGVKEGFGKVWKRGGEWEDAEWRSGAMVELLGEGVDPQFGSASKKDNWIFNMPDIVEFYTDFDEWDRMLADLEEMMLSRPEPTNPVEVSIYDKHQRSNNSPESQKESTLHPRESESQNIPIPPIKAETFSPLDRNAWMNSLKQSQASSKRSSKRSSRRN